LQRNERLALEKHARNSGYKIIISPDYVIHGRDRRAIIARFKNILKFLELKEITPAVVAIQNKETLRESLTIVGDWFMAESVSFKKSDGFTNTFFTRDSFEIIRHTEDFECELQELLEQRGWTPENSREKAIDKLDRIIHALEELNKTDSEEQIMTVREINIILEIVKD